MLYANTDDGSSAIWVLDGNGVVIDNISYAIGERAPILAQINEHYGTSFTGWSDNEIGLRYGDTLPNWNAYEKISKLRWEIQFAGTNGVFGIIENNTFKVYANNATNVLIASNEGVVVGTQNYSSEFGDFMKNKLVAAELNVQSVEQFITSLNVGDNVPDWSLYNITN